MPQGSFLSSTYPLDGFAQDDHTGRGRQSRSIEPVREGLGH